MSKNTDKQQLFPGFSAPNYTQVPDELFDDLMVDLSGAELKVLLYIIRRTFGFKKTVDNISLNQLLFGIKTKEGEILDKGTGLSKKTLLTALKSLVLKNIIITERRRTAEHGNEPTAYRLNLASNNSVKKVGVKTTPTLGVKTTPTLGVKTTPRARSNNSPIQETVLQQTDLQLRNSNIKIANNRSDENKVNPRFQTIGELLKKKTKKKLIDVQTIPDSLKVTIEDISREFGEPRSYRSNLTHIMRICQQAGKNPEGVVAYLYEARSITKQQGSVKKPMPYFFSVLKDLVGLPKNTQKKE